MTDGNVTPDCSTTANSINISTPASFTTSTISGNVLPSSAVTPTLPTPNCPGAPPKTSLCQKVDRITMELLEIRCMLKKLSCIIEENLLCDCPLPPVEPYKCLNGDCDPCKDNSCKSCSVII